MVAQLIKSPITDKIISFVPRLIGICTITSYEELPNGQLKFLGRKSYRNLVNRRAVEFFFSNNGVFTDQLGVAITPDIYTQSYERTTLDNVTAIGNNSFFAPNDYIFTPETESTPNLVTYYSRFPAPSSQRDYNSIGLVDGTTDNDIASLSFPCYAYLTLPTTKTQFTNQIDDITYEISVVWENPDQTLNPYFQQEYALKMLDQFGQDIGYQYYDLSPAIFSPSNPDFDLRFLPVASSNQATLTDRIPYLKKEFNATISSFPRNQTYYGAACGRMERNLNDRFKGTATGVNFKTNSQITRTYSHEKDSEELWDNSDRYASSSWRPIITDLGSTNDQLPALYTLTVKTDGNLTSPVGTYFVTKTPFSGGLEGSAWSQRPNALAITTKHPYIYDDEESITLDPSRIYPWINDRLWVSKNSTKVAIWEVYPELLENQVFDLGSSNSVTRINDLAVNEARDRIYAACEEGLFEIDPSGPAINVLSTDRAIAVDVSFGDQVIAVLIDGTNQGRLASSFNGGWGNALPFTGTINYENVLFIRCDRTSPAHNTGILEHTINVNDPAPAIVIAVDTPFAYIHWWNNTTGYQSTLDCLSKTNTATQWHPHATHPTNNSFIVQDSVWLYPKFISHDSFASGFFPGMKKNLIKVIQEGGKTLINSDGSIPNTNTNIPRNYQVGASQFNNEIGGDTYSATNMFEHGYPIFAILEVDLANDKISFIAGGFSESTGFSGGYVPSVIRQTCGCYDLNVNTTTPLNGFTEYKNETDINKFFFSNRNSGAGTEPLYYFSGNILRLQNGGIISFLENSISRANYLWGGFTEASSTFYNPIVVSFWGAPTKLANDNYIGWSVRYGWNDVSQQWELDPLGTLSGRPMTDTDVALIDNLLIRWVDEAPLQAPPQTSQDLNTDEYYTFGRLFSNNGFISDGTYNTPLNISWSIYLRPMENVGFSGTVPVTPDYELTVPEASSDPLWLSLDPFEGKPYKLTIDGVAAVMIFSGSPNPGEILVKDARLGIFEFNSADSGKAIAGNLYYMQKIHSTEVLP